MGGIRRGRKEVRWAEVVTSEPGRRGGSGGVQAGGLASVLLEGEGVGVRGGHPVTYLHRTTPGPDPPAPPAPRHLVKATSQVLAKLGGKEEGKRGKKEGRRKSVLSSRSVSASVATPVSRPARAPGPGRNSAKLGRAAGPARAPGLL